jgi:hypothetical protein
MSRRDDDIERLHRCLVEASRRYEADGEDGTFEEPSWERPFRRMRSDLESNRFEELTDKQRAWVHGVCEKLFDEPTYSNDWSSGKVPRGDALKTPTPEVLKRPLPLKPPGRR